MAAQSILSWLTGIKNNSQYAPKTRKPTRRHRLAVEPLEDRSVPATFAVNTALDTVVAGDGKLSLREAITAANNHAGADVIVLPAGVFKIGIGGAGEDTNLSGDFDIKDTLTIQGAGAGLTVVDGQQKDRVFDVLGTAPSSIRVAFQGLTVRGGNTTSVGGGILVVNADLVVRGCAVVGNRAFVDGGGIATNVGEPGTRGGDVTLVHTTVARNATSGNGGGIFVVGDGGVLTVKDSAVRRNVAGSDGGGLFAGTATLTNCTLSGNSAVVFGGGVWATAATLTNCTVSSNAAHGITGSGGGIGANVVTLTGCTVSGNTAADDGGGIFAVTATLTNSTVSGNSAFAGGGLFAGTATLTNSTVSGNVALASNGGGIHAATANLTNTTVAGNTAGSSGGGVWATAATLVNDTVADNIAHTGGGLFHNPGGTFNVQNTIVALNLIDFGGAGPDVSGAFTSLGHNLIGDGTGSTSFTNGLNSDIVGTAANPIDPKLGALRNNGGRTMTMALLAGSPAIDHGDNTVTLASDQRGIGIARKKDGNGDGIAVVDVGAFER